MRNFHLCLTIVGLCFMTSCNLSKEQTTKEYIKLVKTAEVIETSSLKEKQFPGIIEEAQEVNLAFRVAGPIDEILVKEGDYVKEGQLIARMDSRDYQLQYQAAKSQVQQVNSEYKRIAELKKRNGVSDNDYEKMKAGKDMANTKLSNAKDQLEDTKLYAPFSGYITKVNFKDGELVNHGTPIVSIVDISMLKVEIEVPASFYIYRDSISNFECTQENIPNEVYTLKLYGNNIKANSNGLYKLYLYHTPEEGCILAPGMNVNVTVIFNSKHATHLSIPINAIVKGDNGDFVWVVNEDSTINKRDISADDDIQYGMVTVSTGLYAGEKIVVGGLHQLKEGEIVRVVAKPSPTNIGNLL